MDVGAFIDTLCSEYGPLPHIYLINIKGLAHLAIKRLAAPVITKLWMFGTLSKISQENLKNMKTASYT